MRNSTLLGAWRGARGSGCEQNLSVLRSQGGRHAPGGGAISGATAATGEPREGRLNGSETRAGISRGEWWGPPFDPAQAF